MTLDTAYLTLGRQITDWANQDKIESRDRAAYYRRAAMARALLRAAAALDNASQQVAVTLGKVLSTPIVSGPAAGKDWRCVAELAYRLGRQVARGEQGQQRSAA